MLAWLAVAAGLAVAASPAPPMVGMGEYDAARAADVPAIETVGVATCIAVFLYDPQAKAGALGHFAATTDAARSIAEMRRALEAAGGSWKRARASVIGGWDTSKIADVAGFRSTSPELLAQIKAALRGVPIVKEQTLAVPFSGQKTIRNLRADLETGALEDFEPNGPVVPSSDSSDPSAPRRPLRRHAR